jgi:hypothetical protein
MCNALTHFTLLGALAASTAVFAATSPNEAATQPGTRTTAAQTASHAVRGIVKSVDASSLVITRFGNKASNLRFVLNPSTLREGMPAVGSTVSVRYRIQGNTLIATAVTAHTGQHAVRTPSVAR